MLGTYVFYRELQSLYLFYDYDLNLEIHTWLLSDLEVNIDKVKNCSHAYDKVTPLLLLSSVESQINGPWIKMFASIVIEYDRVIARAWEEKCWIQVRPLRSS